MVHYIGKRKQKFSWNKYLLIGGVGLALAIGTYKFAYSDRKQDEQAIPSIQNQLTVQTNIESIDTRLDSILSELRSSPEFMDKNYEKLVNTVEEELARHPSYKNRLVRSGLEDIDKDEIDSDTYIVMFDIIKDKAEEKPELMDYFGENAKQYMKKKFVDEYLDTIDDAFSNTFSNLKEKSQPVIEALGKARTYLIEKIVGE